MNELLRIIVWGLPGWVVALIAILYVTKWIWKDWLKTYAEENAEIATINDNFTNALEQLKETNWLKTYAEENAKIATINENFTNSLEQLKETNWLKTYAEENAKIATINDNFTNALEQLKETTREVALIQNAISNQIWVEQWRMNQKRDIYVKLIEIIEQWTLERGKVRYHPEASRDRESDVINKFRQARAVARLVLEAELIGVAVHHVVRDVYPVDPRTATEGEYGLTRQRLREVRDGIVAAGRRELQFGASSATRVALLDQSASGLPDIK